MTALRSLLIVLFATLAHCTVVVIARDGTA